MIGPSATLDPPELARLLAGAAEGASERERERALPHGQIAHLARAGFGTLRIPKEQGGHGVSVRRVFEVLIDLAEADSNVAQILRAHFGFVEALRLTPPSEQRDATVARIVAGEIVGNAITEASGAHAGDFLGLGTTIAPDGDGFVIDGTKAYSTGTLYADHVWVWGVTPDGTSASAVVPTDRAGVEADDDWDGFGQRLTGTGTTRFRGVRATAEEVTVADATAELPRAPLGAFLQLFLTAVIAGTLRAVDDDTVALLRRRTRSFTHGSADLPRRDPVLLQVSGEIASEAYAAQAIVLDAASAIDRAFADLHAGRTDTGSAEEASRRAAGAKIVVDRFGLQASARLFEAGGASATKAPANLDRHWRNIRTLASHNPTALKRRVLGDHLVNGTDLPDNTYF